MSRREVVPCISALGPHRLFAGDTGREDIGSTLGYKLAYAICIGDRQPPLASATSRTDRFSNSAVKSSHQVHSADLPTWQAIIAFPCTKQVNIIGVLLELQVFQIPITR